MNVNNIRTNGSFCIVAKKLMLYFEICIVASDVFVSKNGLKGHGILLSLVMESHGIWSAKKSMNPVIGVNMDLKTFGTFFSFSLAFL